MLFSSALFLFKFLPLTLLIYFFLLRNSFRNVFLLIVSLIFYAWGEPVYVLLMLFSILVNFVAGLVIGKSRPSLSKMVLVASIVFNVGLLVYYKYFFFICQNINHLFNVNVGTTHPLALPIGISFYTFHALSYIIDIHRKKVKPQENILNLGLYITFFPQLIAGPIVRYIDISEQIEDRKFEWASFVYGVQRFIMGFAKKILLANTLGQVADRIMQMEPSDISMLASWLGIVCYAFQIFFDFSGYSDMAIGLGRMFGFTFKENFNFPYIAKNLKDFWRRWHISLSTWFRDYLYIPLGGNRGSLIRTHFNLIVVFFITGLWHGASWNFVIWGLLHGFFLILERGKFGLWMEKRWAVIQHAYTLFVVLIAWVFFRMETFRQALRYLKTMMGFNIANDYPFDYDFLGQKVIYFLIAAVICCTPLITFNKMVQPGKFQVLRELAGSVGLILLLILSISDLASQTYNPFIYFRF